MASTSEQMSPFNLSRFIATELQTAANSLGFTSAFSNEIALSDPKFGDYQANGALRYAKSVQQKPQAVAAQLVAELGKQPLAQWFDLSIAGPGFINFGMKAAFSQQWLRGFHDRSTLLTGATASSSIAGQNWVVDYSSPNTAKEMHVGHLRSAVIGEAICRMAEFNGAKIVRDNHIGDWGTQFGKMIWAYKRFLNEEAVQTDPIAEFERLYKVGAARSKEDESVLAEARAELVKLQLGDAENTEIWKRINEVSLQAFQPIYDLLGVKHDVVLGESFYNDKVERVYQELQEVGLAEVSDGALCVFLRDVPRFAKQPFIVRKSDGGANYASTDLATALYRSEVLKCDAGIYVIDSRQSDHLQMLFLTSQRWFAKKGYRLPRMEHVSFGTVLGENRKPLQTRSGENIKLKDLLQEAIDRAFALVTEKSPEVPEEERRSIARIVGIGSVQYADLCQTRTNDYEFSWSKMISLEGNTAAYMLYAIARIYSIFEKLALAPGDAAFESQASPLETPTELLLARKLCKFPEALQRATDQLMPHMLCAYAYELAGDFNSFYRNDHVSVPEVPVKARRAMLCARTLLVLETTLHVLGLRTLQRM